MIVFLDCDGVLADFVSGACLAHNRPSPYADPKNHGNWHFDKLWGMTPTQFEAPMQFGFWAGLEPTHDGSAIRRAAEQLALQWGGMPYLLTKLMPTPGCLEGKRVWVERHLPDYSRRLIFAHDKAVIAGPGKLLIDDSDANVADWRKAGGNAILVPRKWNKQHRESDIAAVLVKSQCRSYYPPARAA